MLPESRHDPTMYAYWQFLGVSDNQWVDRVSSTCCVHSGPPIYIFHHIAGQSIDKLELVDAVIGFVGAAGHNMPCPK